MMANASHTSAAFFCGWQWTMTSHSKVVVYLKYGFIIGIQSGTWTMGIFLCVNDRSKGAMLMDQVSERIGVEGWDIQQQTFCHAWI